MALTIGEGAIISEGVMLQGHTVERLAATFLPTECAACMAPRLRYCNPRGLDWCHVAQQRHNLHAALCKT
jgi:hypothetical protein